MDMRMVTKRHAFGIKGDVKDNIHYLDDTTVAYPVGRNIVIYSTQTNTQKFIPCAEKAESITALAVSPNRKWLAVAESGEVPAIAIYDTTTRKRKKLLSVPDVDSQEYICIAFSSVDGRYLVTQAGYPSWNLVYWNWERSKALSMICSVADKQANRQDRSLVTQCSLNPRDPQHMCVTGNGVFNFFRYADSQLKLASGGLGKRDPQNFLAHVWLPPDDRLVVSTDNGDLLLVENSEILCVLALSPSDGLAIETLIATSKGFITGGDVGVINIYEKTEDKDLYRRMKTMKVSSSRDQHNKDPDAAATTAAAETDSIRVRSFSLSQQEEYLCLSTSNNQIYVLNLSNADFSKAEDVVFEPLSHPFHSGPITGVDTCIRKPLIATCGKDKTVRIWNYLENSLEILKTFPSEPYSIAMHPSGLHILVGFSDKLRFMNLYGDDIREFKSFQIRACQECAFSCGGQYFAAVHGNIIHIYSTYTCDTIGHLRGHNGKVRCLYWLPDDTKLVSVGMDGAVYDWNVKDCRKENEYVAKSVNYTSVVADQKNLWVVGSDRKLRELESNLGSLAEHDTMDYTLTALALSPTHRLLLAGADDGSIRVFSAPIQGGIQEQSMAHCGAITRMAITFDESLLFSVAEDGVLFMYDLKDKEGRSAKHEITYAEEILISKADLEEKNGTVTELRQRVEELKLDMDYQLRRREIKHEEKLKELTDQFREESERQQAKYDSLLAMKNEQDINFTEIRRELTEKHRAENSKQESDYQAQIQALEEQIAKLKRDLEAQKKDAQSQLANKEAQMEKTRKEMDENFQEALMVEKEMNESLRQEQKELTKEHEEIRRQLEQDTDFEIEEIKREYETRLQTERENYLHLKGENGIMRKKFNTLQKDINEKNEEIRLSYEKHQALEDKIRNLERDIDALKNEIKERDETIGDKEKRIYDLKKKNQELEKFKFVLDYKIRELKNQIEPRQEEIAQAKQKIKEMDLELERYHQNNLSLVLTINELKLRIAGQQKEIRGLANRVKDSEVYRTRIRNDLSELANMIQNPKSLKELVKKLYQKHVNERLNDTQEMEEDLQKEYHRQRDYLEKTVESLKRKLVKDADSHKIDTNRIMNENVILIREINELRREIKNLRLAAQVKLDQEGEGGGTPAAGEGQPATEGTTSTTTTATVSNTVVQRYQRELELQRLELQRLRVRIDDLEKQLYARGRPVSRERLPPMEGFYDPNASSSSGSVNNNKSGTSASNNGGMVPPAAAASGTQAVGGYAGKPGSRGGQPLSSTTTPPIAAPKPLTDTTTTTTLTSSPSPPSSP